MNRFLRLTNSRVGCAARRSALTAFFLAVALLSAAEAQCPYPGCPAGTPCIPRGNVGANNTNCASTLCMSVDGAVVCKAPRCDDSVQNGYEAGFDCGGGCKGCDESSGCNVGQDCRSGVCGNSFLDDIIRCRQGSCTDKVQSLTEPDIDCGASACCQEYEDIAKCPNLCQVGQRCLTARDCSSGKCFRLPRMGGDRFCAGTRPTDIDGRLTTRILTGFRVEGQRRAFFNTSRFQEIVAFMLDVPSFSVYIEAVTDVSRTPEFGIGAYADIVNASKYAGWSSNTARRLARNEGDNEARKSGELVFSEGQFLPPRAGGPKRRQLTTDDHWELHKLELASKGLPEPYSPRNLEEMTAPLQFVRGKKSELSGRKLRASILPSRDPSVADWEGDAPIYEVDEGAEGDEEVGHEVPPPIKGDAQRPEPVTLKPAKAKVTRSGRRLQTNIGEPTWDRYYITTTDTAIAVEVRMSIFVQPFEAKLIESRILGMVSGMKVHADGWLAERVIGRQKFETEWLIDYCSNRVNATTVNMTFATEVDCNYYANKTIWRIKEEELQAAIAAEQAKTASKTSITSGASSLDGQGESGMEIVERNGLGRRLLGPLLDNVASYGRRLGSGEEVGYAALAGVLYTVGTDYFAIPRVTTNDLLLPMTPSYAMPPRISLLDTVAYDQLYDLPNNEMRPYELLVIVQPRGVPERPLWDYYPIAIQPVLKLVDRHDRPITSITPNVRVLAGLDKERYPPEKSDVLLFGDISQSLIKSDGTFRFSRLYFNLNTSQTEILFEASWLGGVNEEDGTNTYLYLRTQTRVFDVLPHPVPPIIIIPRIPLHPVIVALITILCIGAVIGSWYYFTKWRTNRMASVKIMDVRLIDPHLAKLAAQALAQRQAMLENAKNMNDNTANNTRASTMANMINGATALDSLDLATVHALAEQAKAAQKAEEEGLITASSAVTPYSPGGPKRPQTYGLPDPSAFPYGEDDPLPAAFAVLPPGMRPVAVYTTEGSEQALSIAVKQKPLPKEAPSPDKEKKMPVLTTSPGPGMATVVVAIPHAKASEGVPCHVIPMHSIISPAGAPPVSPTASTHLPGQAVSPSSPSSPSAATGQELVGFRPGPASGSFSPSALSFNTTQGFGGQPAPLPGTAADLAFRSHGPLPKNRNAPPNKIGFSKDAIRADTFENAGLPKPFNAPPTATSTRTFTSAAAGLLSVFRTATRSSTGAGNDDSASGSAASSSSSSSSASGSAASSSASATSANTKANAATTQQSKKVKPAAAANESDELTLVDESPRTRGWMKRNHKNTMGNIIEKGGKAAASEDPMAHLNLALSRMDVRMMALEDDNDAVDAIGQAAGVPTPRSGSPALSPSQPGAGSRTPSRGFSLSPSRR